MVLKPRGTRICHASMLLLAVSLPLAAPAQVPPPMHEKHGPAAEEEGMPAETALPWGPGNREASGTAWQPASSPMYAHHYRLQDWETMVHYNAFLTYNAQGGARGETQAGSVNWAMIMARRSLSAGQIMLRGMFSVEPISTAGDGYPLLFQTGESWQDEPLVDRQHPHDAFMELAARYDQPLTGGLQGFVYVAPAGEPALGPVAYPHRLSAFENPLAPLGHHWQDSTHITFGVVTAGVYDDRWQAETSVFTGREPDEERWDIDPLRFDSQAGRLTFNPDPNWSFSASYGFLSSPEALHPDEDLRRAVISAMYTAPWGKHWLATTGVWGRNTKDGEESDNYLLEATVNRGRHHYFGRVEHVTRSGEELALAPEDSAFRIAAATLGYVNDVYSRGIDVGIGAGVTFYRVPEDLQPIYDEAPRSYVVFVRIRPSGIESGGQSH